MFKRSLIILLVTMSVYFAGAGEDFKTPERGIKRRDSTALYQSPQQVPSDFFVNFRDCLLQSLEENDISAFSDHLKRFYKKAQYDMHIKDQAFYASIFYLILRELSGTRPALQSGSSIETMRLFFKNTAQTYFALEVFVASRGIDIAKFNKRNSYSYMCIDGHEDKLHTFTTIRIVIDFSNGTDERASLQVYTFKPKTKNYRIIDSNKVGTLNVNAHKNSTLESPAHKIIRILDKEFIDDALLSVVQENLAMLYNNVPKKFRDQFKEGGHEKYYQALFYWISQFLRGNYAEAECRANNGRVDLLLRSTIGNNILRYIIIEFKHRERDAKKGLKQILDREYYNMVNLSAQAQPILLLSINVISSGDQVKVSKILFSFHDPKTISSPLKVMTSSPGYRFKMTDETDDESDDETMKLPVGALNFQEFIS